MSLPKNINRYRDVKRVLDSALPGPARYRLATPGKAMYWRQRAYQFRKLFIENAAVESGYIATPYDNMKLTIDGCDVIIETEVPEGELYDAQGRPIQIAPDFDDDMPSLSDVARLVELRGEDEEDE